MVNGHGARICHALPSRIHGRSRDEALPQRTEAAHENGPAVIVIFERGWIERQLLRVNHVQGRAFFVGR